MEIWYRYDYERYSPGVNDYGDPLPGVVIQLRVKTFFVQRRTPKGVWLCQFWGPEASAESLHTAPRFVLLSARRRFACPSLEEAKTSFIVRKLREISIHQRRVETAKAALELLSNPNQFSRFVP